MSDDGGASEWPKTVRIGGRAYEIHPEMSMVEFTEVQQTLQNEIEPLIEMMDALGIDVELGGE